MLIGHNQKEVEEKISRRKTANVSLEDFKKTTLTGTPAECIGQLEDYVDLGVTYFMLFFSDLPSLDGIRLFAQNVIDEMKG